METYKVVFKNSIIKYFFVRLPLGKTDFKCICI